MILLRFYNTEEEFLYAVDFRYVPVIGDTVTFPTTDGGSWCGEVVSRMWNFKPRGIDIVGFKLKKMELDQ